MKKMLVASMLMCSLSMALDFSAPPSLARDAGSGKWTVTFAVSAFTDVEVAIVSLEDSTIIRHLAAGVLGSNPPPPLTANTLSQTLEWDGKDDFGKAASATHCTVRVRAGLSVRLAGLEGEDLYTFNSSLAGIVLASDGSVLIAGSAASPGNWYGSGFLRKYDASGNYMKTLFPPPAELSKDSVTAYGVNVLPGGGWAPLPLSTGDVDGATRTASFLKGYGTINSTKMLPLGGPGEIVLVNGTDVETMHENGAFVDSGKRKIITAPPPPDGGWTMVLMGPQYYTLSHDPKYFYLSGLYYGWSNGMNSWLVTACDTGFWADGQVFKVNRETGVATSWIKLDSVPTTPSVRVTRLFGGANNVAAIHGVATDDSGHVFVCDRLHKRIGVYDTNATLIGSVTCVAPDFVAVSKRTGALYVIQRTTNAMILLKYEGWRNPGASTAKTTLLTFIDEYTSAPTIVLTESHDTTNLWVGQGTLGARLYRDDLTKFTLLRDLSAATSPLCWDHIAVDPKTETVFSSLASCATVYKVGNDNNRKAVICSTSAGGRLLTDDITVSPKGFIYGPNAAYYTSGGIFDQAVQRYRWEGGNRFTPLPYANTGTNTSTNAISFEGMNHRGMAVGWQDQIAVFDECYNLYVFPDTGYSDTTFKGLPTVTTANRWTACGVKFDPAGNLYVGAGVKASDWAATPGFESNKLFNDRSGSIVKFAAGTTGSISGTGGYYEAVSTAVNAAKVYPQPYGNFSGRCTCRSPRFDVDAYGRLYVPNGISSSVSMADNAGNTIVTFGQYGNSDSRGPEIGMAWPNSVAASEDYIYVADFMNQRLVSVKMDYAIDNLPNVVGPNAASEKAGVWKGLSITSSPNPCNTVSRIRIAMPASGNIRLSVYSVDGRLIRTLSQGALKAGIHQVVWNGTDNRNRSVSAGIYVHRLEAGNRILFAKTILAR